MSRLTLKSKAPPPAEAVVEDIVQRMTLRERLAKEIQDSHLAPAGSLGLPELLDQKRLRYGIVNEAFEAKPAFDRVYVHQLLPKFQEGETYAGTSIEMPETAEKREYQESCRGVLISAGLKAMDNLKSNGILVGDTIEFIRFGIFHKPVCALAGGHLIYVLVLRDGDIIGSEEFVERERAGVHTVIESRVADGVFEHRLMTDEREYRPREAFVDESY